MPMNKIYELQTEFKRAIENINTLKEQYTVLNEIVENSGRKEQLPTDFVENLNQYKENADGQLLTINKRLDYANTLINWYEKQDEAAKVVDQIVTLTLQVLGIDNGEEVKQEEVNDKTVEEQKAE